MRTTRSSLAALLLVTGSWSRLPAPIRPMPQGTIAETLDSWITNTEQHVVQLADAMPADRYGFSPPPGLGAFKDVRTFGAQATHLAANNYRVAALIMGEVPAPEMASETGPDSVRTKAQVLAYLRGSFAALHRAVATIQGANATSRVATSSAWQTNRLSFAFDAVAHSFDHYGQMVEYLRMNGIIPPDSRPAAP